MILELSERDRGTILQHHLYQVVMEKKPAYLSDEILSMMTSFDKEYAGLNATTVEGILQRQIMDQRRKTFEGYQDETKEITLADYMKAPYSRVF